MYSFVGCADVSTRRFGLILNILNKTTNYPRLVGAPVEIRTPRLPNLPVEPVR